MTKNVKYNTCFYDFGYNYFGPFLFSYVQWIKEKLIKYNINKVYFLARDGFVMKEAFDLINDNKDIKSYYFYASRRSITVPSFAEKNNYIDAINSITLPERIELASLLKRMGLDDINKEKYLKKYNLNISNIYSLKEIKESDNFQKFFNELFPIIKNNSLQEKNNLLEYAEANSFNGKVAVVDIGWHGSMQIALSDIFPQNDIYGFYVGLSPNGLYTYNEFSNKFNGFICDQTHGFENYAKLHNFIELFEFMFLAQHGSVKKFKKNDVELYEYEYKNRNEKEYALSIQKGAIDYIDNKENIFIPDDVSIKNLLDYFLYPNLKVAILFGDLQFMDNNLCYVAKPKSLIKYLFDLKDMKRDYVSSLWRIGFLKRLFKVKLPYYLINKMLRKIFKKEW